MNGRVTASLRIVTGEAAVSPAAGAAWAPSVSHWVSCQFSVLSLQPETLRPDSISELPWGESWAIRKERLSLIMGRLPHTSQAGE
jgi:hypothetical protein